MPTDALQEALCLRRLANSIDDGTWAAYTEAAAALRRMADALEHLHDVKVFAEQAVGLGIVGVPGRDTYYTGRLHLAESTAAILRGPERTEEK